MRKCARTMRVIKCTTAPSVALGVHDDAGRRRTTPEHDTTVRPRGTGGSPRHFPGLPNTPALPDLPGNLRDSLSTPKTDATDATDATRRPSTTSPHTIGVRGRPNATYLWKLRYSTKDANWAGAPTNRRFFTPFVRGVTPPLGETFTNVTFLFRSGVKFLVAFF